MDTNKFYLTNAKYNALLEEIKYLEGEGNMLMARLLALSPSSGMGRPNDLPAHIMAGEMMGYLQEIKAIVHQAEIIDQIRDADPDMDKVVLGSTVFVQYDEDDEIVEYTILGQKEVDLSRGKLSCFSPVGAALLGKRKGDRVVTRTPGSFRDICMQIMNVERKSLDFNYPATSWKEKLERELLLEAKK